LHVYEGLSGRLIMTLLKPSLLKGIDLLPNGKSSHCSTFVLSASRGLASDRDHLPGRQGRCVIAHFTFPEVMAYLESAPRMHYVTGLGTNSVTQAPGIGD